MEKNTDSYNKKRAKSIADKQKFIALALEIQKIVAKENNAQHVK